MNLADRYKLRVNGTAEVAFKLVDVLGQGLKYFMSALCLCHTKFGCWIIVDTAANLNHSIPLADNSAFNVHFGKSNV